MTVRPFSVTRLRGFRRPRRPARILPALLGLAGVLALLVPAATPQDAAAAPVRAYRGLGSWVDVYDAGVWNEPVAAARDMKARGVRTLYLETANYHLPAGAATMFRRADVARLIEAAHARGMKVVAWYLPGFDDLARDYRRTMAAIRFRTPSGQRFDSFALDIEASIVKDVDLRTGRLLALSRRIRAAVGDAYPLGAIIPSPVGMAMYPGYWPGFPYEPLARVFDVFVPMGYYTYHGDGYANAYRDTRDTIRLIREETGRPGIPIHVIAGEGSKSSLGETTAYVRALREHGVLGGGMYDWATTRDAGWRALRNVRMNPRQAAVLPLTLPYAPPLGFCPADRTHPKEAFYETAGQDGDRVLRYRLYDAQADEIRLLVNWRDMGPLSAGPAKAWSTTRAVVVPADLLVLEGPNVIGFVARGDYPDWRRWGVRDVSIAAP